MASIGSDVQQLAKDVQAEDGINYQVVEAQWGAEQGSNGVLQSTANWSRFGNNPAGLKLSTGSDADTADSLAYGSDSHGFLLFSTPEIGAQAYAYRWNDPVYQQTMQALKGQGVQEQLTAIYESPWDSGHYAGNSGIPGYNLMAQYAAIRGSTIGAELSANEATNAERHGMNGGSIAAQTVGNSITDLAKVATGNSQSITSSANNAVPGVGGTTLNVFGGKFTTAQLLVLLGGTVLIILLLYRTVTK